jgi:hypothetical protein
MSDNAINTAQSQLANPECGDYQPVAGSAAFTVTAVTLIDFTWNPGVTPTVPIGTLTNTVTSDFNGTTRTALNPVGAFFTAGAAGACNRVHLPLVIR